VPVGSPGGPVISLCSRFIGPSARHKPSRSINTRSEKRSPVSCNMKSALGRVLNDTQQGVEQRLSRINLAQVIADLRGDVRGGLKVIRSGLSPNDRVIIERNKPGARLATGSTETTSPCVWVCTSEMFFDGSCKLLSYADALSLAPYMRLLLWRNSEGHSMLTHSARIKIRVQIRFLSLDITRMRTYA
jgi:hypothetical protein